MTQESVLINAPAHSVWVLVADPARMTEWSPECVTVRWIGSERCAAVGARFRGTSRNGRRRWSTTSVITAMQPDELFAWEVSYFRRPVARWEYRLEVQPGGVRLVESVHDRRGWLLRRVSPLITGSPDRSKRNAETMETTLQAIRTAAERQGHER
jgi:hypothetical protein